MVTQAAGLSSNAEADWRSVDKELARRRAGLQQAAEVCYSLQTAIVPLTLVLGG